MSEAETADAVLHFDVLAHPVDVVQRAAYRFSDRISVELVRDGDTVVCRVFGRDGAPLSGELLHELRAEVVDQALRARIREETAGVRNLILAVAFSRTPVAGGGEPCDGS
jgi:His-Xaa-Ser system protein HxsD